MPKYTVYLQTAASTSVHVEAENADAALDAAYEEEMPRICAQCSGWGGGPQLDLGDEWDVLDPSLDVIEEEDD